MVYKIIWSPTFFYELENIYNYIFFYIKEPKIAKRIYYNTTEKISLLEYSPERFARVYYKTNINLRKFLVKNFVVIYEIDNNLQKIYVLHIFHNNQNYLKLI